MDQRVRLATAAAVMLVGLGLALAFRRPSVEADLAIPTPGDGLVVRKQPSPQKIAGENSPPAPQPHAAPGPADEPRQLSPTIVQPTDRPAAPPELPTRYPNNNEPAGIRWGASLREVLPEANSAPPMHKVVNGDSLALLAER